jgi:hypothetical protein
MSALFAHRGGRAGGVRSGCLDETDRQGAFSHIYVILRGRHSGSGLRSREKWPLRLISLGFQRSGEFALTQAAF